MTYIEHTVVALNEPLSIVANAKLNGKCGQTWTLASSIRSAIGSNGHEYLNTRGRLYEGWITLSTG